MFASDLKTRTSPIYLTNLRNEWRKFLEGDTATPKYIRKEVYESWARSKKAGVDPFNFSPSIIFNKEDAQKQAYSHEDLIKSFGRAVNIIQEIAHKNKLKLQLFDKNGYSVNIILSSSKKETPITLNSYIVRDINEEHVGTNAVSLCLHTGKPVQLVGPEHFHSLFHNNICSCAPIHDNENNVIGALNVFCTLQESNIDALPLTVFLASIFDNRSLVTNVLEELNVYEFAMRHIVKYLPQGIAYLGQNCDLKAFNNAFLKLLSLGPSEDIKYQIEKFASNLEYIKKREDISKKELLLDIQGKKKSFLVTTKNIFTNKNSLRGQFLIMEDTEEALKSLAKLRGNKAVYTFDHIIGENSQLLAAKGVALQVADSPVPVLIVGESGTGKELFAQAIHNSSDRANEPFVAINCGAIPPELIESELFGYVAGAFTGALKSGKTGKLELAHGGTLFFDEVESMPLNVQIKLLRALSTKRICRVGGVDEIPIDIRLISACKGDLLDDADKGNFREDLYYRISTILVNLPSLRDRKNDIPLLAKHFLKLCGSELGAMQLTMEGRFLNALSDYSWRGNIRELRNVIERAIVLRKESTELSLDLLPERIIKSHLYKDTKKVLEPCFSATGKDSEKLDILKIAEEIAIEKVFIQENGNITKISKALGISKPTLYSKINKSKKLSRLKESLENDSNSSV
ncbi:sigma-54-dependent Fis family transcriptional regulator [Syntrophotalea acetylenica]|uniref:Sigma-54 factor interaction domain-containing protein n=1 Tax=Syntrophotalea acetylenica TaxID=29542 RepID=A0A1L3GDC9_SYNAC|nr:sigma 54-interacting transcriptional regulator [Syntrophotalea acetylenica]APG23954.1 hypothetical protein A7E75_02140 [Syntrophotalea acetylenica]APG44536.1 hypothetical protein A6070_10760 [Syntrophotalea acetylenica]